MRFTTNLAMVALLGLASAATSGRAFALQTTQPADALRPTTTTTTTTGPPSTMPAGTVALTATVTAVKGIVQVRAGEGAAWQPATVGMKLDQGAEIRTGLRSAIQILIGDDQTITLDRLGTVTLLQAFQDQGRAKTDLGLKYGRARYDIRETDLQHESTIRSPGSTLAIRGTDVIYEDQAPWVPQAISREGRAEFRNYRRQFLAFGGTRRAAVAADKNSAAQQALSTTKADPRGAFAGRTESEEELTLSLQTIGGVDAQGLQALQDLARISGFTDTFAGVPPVPGPLEFQLAWFSTAATPGPSNLDLLVTDPLGNTASPTNTVIGAGSATGMHFGDDVGAGGAGAENVVWGLFFPAGNYTVTASHKGGDDAQVFIDVLQGQASDSIASFGRDTPIVLKPGESFSGDVTASGGGNVSNSQRTRAARQRVAVAKPAKVKALAPAKRARR